MSPSDSIHELIPKAEKHHQGLLPDMSKGWLMETIYSLAQGWERLLLALLLTAMAAMTLNLLWPKPQATITLKPYVGSMVSIPVDASAVESITLADSSSSQDLPLLASDSPTQKTGKKSAKHRGTNSSNRKKPEKPPITSLNSATEAQLSLLPGIGPKMAQRIIAYRKAHGPFSTIEQVMDVKGIGLKKFEKMKPFLRL